MKKIFLLFFTLSSCYYSYSQHISTGIKTLKSENLKGPIKEIIKDDGTLKFHYFYNEDGYLYKELYFFKGELSIEKIFEFDSIKKLPIKLRKKTKTGTEHIYTYKYNDDGKLIELFQDFDKKTSFRDRKIKYEYDSLGRLKKEIANGKKKEILTHYYLTDSLIENIYVKSGKEYFLFDKIYYNQKGLIIKKIRYTELGLNSTEIFDYNEHNDIICRKYFFYSEVVKPCDTKRIYEYDKFNNYIEKGRTIIYSE